MSVFCMHEPGPQGRARRVGDDDARGAIHGGLKSGVVAMPCVNRIYDCAQRLLHLKQAVWADIYGANWLGTA